jgi:transcriptional regulator with PAS, ATPase and Fis domain
MIENALTRALVDGRSQIYACDIEIIGSMKSAVGTASGKNVTRSNIEALNGRFGEVLLRHISAGENFDQAKDVLRKIMIQIASKKYSGNKSKIAASLGISRQSLYDHEFQ